MCNGATFQVAELLAIHEGGPATPEMGLATQEGGLATQDGGLVAPEEKFASPKTPGGLRPFRTAMRYTLDHEPVGAPAEAGCPTAILIYSMANC